jgi:hypothetical protein
MINIDYKYTTIYSKTEDFLPVEGSKYIYGYSPESRSHTIDTLRNGSILGLEFVQIEHVENEHDQIIVNNDSQLIYNLRDSSKIKGLLLENLNDVLYIDVSGLNNRITAALLYNAIRLITDDGIDIDIRIIYIEPMAYNIKQFRAEGVFNDLSEKISGIEPLPGFANIIPDDYDFKFVALLGFEGGRFTYLIDNIQPAYDNIIPVIGVPGYRIEYPFVAYWGNRRPLKTTRSYENIKFAAANSLVDVYRLLTRIYNSSGHSKIKLAPIGTKPHAIGAMLFALKHPNDVELVYDNPKRKSVRTEGVGLLVECCLTKLFKEI